MIRVQLRTVMAVIGVFSLLSIAFQYINMDQVKSRRGRFQVMDEMEVPSIMEVHKMEKQELTPDLETVVTSTTTTPTTPTTTTTTTSTTTTTKYPCNVDADIHAFYYPWYGAPKTDGDWSHWNHPVLPHWIKSVNNKYPIGKVHIPPGDIGSTYYPELGPYSSANDTVIDQHLRWCCQAGIGTLIVSYFAQDRTDDNGMPFQAVVDKLINAAEGYGIRIGFHMEPYHGRTAASVRDDIKDTIDKYGARTNVISIRNNKPVFYLYDSYQIKSQEWSRALRSLRNTKYDPFVIGLIVEPGHIDDILLAGFDAAYSYFAAINFSYGCTPRNWQTIKKSLEKKNIEFYPSVGPGYDDTSIRPWNVLNSKSRNGGSYYTDYFDEAIKLDTNVITITSFNEWHEGTQIEPAVKFTAAKPRVQGPQTYPSYDSPLQYLELTRNAINKWKKT